MRSVNSDKQPLVNVKMKSKNVLARYFLFIIAIIGFSTLATLVFLFQSVEKSAGFYENYLLNSDQHLVNFRKFPDQKKSSIYVPEIKTVLCNLPGYKSSKCLVNNDNKFFVPFEFLRKKFDVSFLYLIKTISSLKT